NPFMSWKPVYELVKQIPRGRVLTYRAVARILHLPGGARTAGRAMARTPSGQGVPWHRVVGAQGKLLVPEPYASLPRKLLQTEGIAMRGSRIDLKQHLWTPGKGKVSSKAPAQRRATLQRAPRKKKSRSRPGNS